MTATLESGLELLLKYRPALWAQGRLALDARPVVAWGLALGGLALVALVVRAYRAGRPRPLLATLRATAVVLVIVCLLRPVLVLDAAVPKRNTVAILVDDSRSMRVRDVRDGAADPRPRADVV